MSQSQKHWKRTPPPLPTDPDRRRAEMKRRRKLSKLSKAAWAKRSPEERQRMIEQLQEGRLATRTPKNVSGKWRVDTELSEADHHEYLALLRSPQSTFGDAQQWLKEHGYAIGDYAIRRHRKELRQQLDQARAAAELAHAFVQASRLYGSSNVSEAVASHAEQQMMQTFFSLLKPEPAGHGLDLGKWENVHKAISLQVKNRGMIEQIRGELEERTKQAAKAPPGDPKESGLRIARRVSEILGLPPPDAPYPPPAKPVGNPGVD